MSDEKWSAPFSGAGGFRIDLRKGLKLNRKDMLFARSKPEAFESLERAGIFRMGDDGEPVITRMGIFVKKIMEVQELFAKDGEYAVVDLIDTYLHMDTDEDFKPEKLTKEDLFKLRTVLFAADVFPPVGTNYTAASHSDINCALCRLLFHSDEIPKVFDGDDERHEMTLCTACFEFNLEAHEDYYKDMTKKMNSRIHFLEFLKRIDTIKGDADLLEKTRLFMFDELPLIEGSGPGDDFPPWDKPLDLTFESCAFECVEE